MPEAARSSGPRRPPGWAARRRWPAIARQRAACGCSARQSRWNARHAATTSGSTRCIPASSTRRSGVRSGPISPPAAATRRSTSKRSGGPARRSAGSASRRTSPTTSGSTRCIPASSSPAPSSSSMAASPAARSRAADPWQRDPMMNDVPARDLTRRNTVDPITLEVLRNALESTADEMGAVLKRTSFSPNIKERMDASCAVFDAKAQLVAQAEHVPVHLGSMLRSVEATIAAVGAVEDGDVVIVNDPFTNGSHLPDITVVAPVFAPKDQGGRHIAYVATRAHHADVGGMEPGSMPGNSREIYQEGLVIPAVRLYRRGEVQEDVLCMILANVRTPEERRGDLNAQLASLRIGERRIRELARRYGVELVTAGFEAILDYTERRMRRRLAEFPPGT